jgi:hypothetical protein
MTKQLSIYECINVLKYYNKDIPKSIYKIKQKTNVLLNKHMFQHSVPVLYHFTFSKHKYIGSNTKRHFIKPFRKTRNLTPNDSLVCNLRCL